jgi:four helix bundle protein
MGKARLQPEFLQRTLTFADRCVAVAEQSERDGRFRRTLEQLAAAGSSVGANLAEADEAISRKDFRRCLAIAMKELAETCFWLALIVHRQWLSLDRLGPLTRELVELKNVVGAILARSAPRSEFSG